MSDSRPRENSIRTIYYEETGCKEINKHPEAWTFNVLSQGNSNKQGATETKIHSGNQ